MIQLVSAAIGTGVALLLLAISLFNGVDWVESLFHAAISGGIMALISRQWCRLIFRASQESDSSTTSGDEKPAVENPVNTRGNASH
jgi:hypothetical protein